MPAVDTTPLHVGSALPAARGRDPGPRLRRLRLTICARPLGERSASATPNSTRGYATSAAPRTRFISTTGLTSASAAKHSPTSCRSAPIATSWLTYLSAAAMRTLDFEGIINRTRALHNRAEMAAKREAIEAEQEADFIAFREFIEGLPLDQRLRRVSRYKTSNRLTAAKLRSKRRGIRWKIARGDVTREFIVRYVHEMEAIAYGF